MSPTEKRTYLLNLRINGTNTSWTRRMEGTILKARDQAEDLAWWLNGILGGTITIAIVNSHGIEVAEIGRRKQDAPDISSTIPHSTADIVKKLAALHLGIENLETQNSDALDFKELAVWNVKAALQEALKAGIEYGRTK